jgi:hypothetical protein
MKERRAGLWRKKSQKGAPIVTAFVVRPILTSSCCRIVVVMVNVNVL